MTYEDKLFEREINCLPLEPYIDSRTYILHECLEGHTWKAQPKKILEGRGCPHCSGRLKKTTSQYATELQGRNISVLGEYNGTHANIEHKCDYCGHKWSPKPSSILKGRGCPECATYRIADNKPCKVYVVSLVFEGIIYYKVGITTQTVANRFGTDWIRFNMQVLFCKEYLTGLDAKAIEANLLHSNQSYKANISPLISGNTEILTVLPKVD